MTTNQDEPRLSRRKVLKTLAGAGAAALAGQAEWLAAADRSSLPAVAPQDFKARTLAYLGSLKRGDGYGWDDQDEAQLTATFAVIGAWHALTGQAPPKPAKLAAFIRTDYPRNGASSLRVYDYQQVQALRWLGDDAADYKEAVRGWIKPVPYPATYEPHQYPVFHNQLTAFICRDLLGLPLSDLQPEFIHYLDERRRANGSFGCTPASGGGDGHVMNTWWAVQAMKTLGRLHEKRAETVKWLQSCQLPCGGFKYAPQPPFGGTDGGAYTWAAVRALVALGAPPAQKEKCVRYLLSLWNVDGGFADRPGWLSNPVATYHAVDALAALGALDEKALVRARPAALKKAAALPAGLKVFTIQIESHGQGSPAEAVDLARALKIDLWGAKNSKPGWIEKAQALADAQKVPVKFFVANEEYGTFVSFPGFGTYSHTSDIVAPAGTEIGPSLAGPDVVSWEDFRKRRLAPLEAGGGRLVWQFGENEELVRALLDDSLQRGGFAAISTFHFGNPDFTYTEPWLLSYRGQIPYIGLQDAHGSEPWWFADITEGFRTLILATEPTWEGWLNALKNNWVVPVRHDAVTGGRTRMHAGSAEIAEFVKAREVQWRWWDNPLVRRPKVSIVAVRPQDEFEAGRPERGVMLRVRTQWENTTQGLPKKQVTELVSLTVDGQKVESKRIVKWKRNKIMDTYCQYGMESPVSGRHTVTAVVKDLITGKNSSRTVEFMV